jgi:transposase
MASIDKQSVRDEFDKIKAGFQEQVSAGKVSPEVASLVNTLMMLFNIILSIFMEKATKKTSANSSIPPSQTEKDETSLPHDPEPGKGNGKGLREKVTTAGNTRTVETTTVLHVSTCGKCGEDLSQVECKCIERRTRIDIMFEKTQEHFDAEVKQCPSCNSTVKAEFPKDLHGPLQYGNGIKAYAIQLLVAQMMSLNRVSKMLVAFIGQAISEATLLGYIMRLHLALEAWEIDAKAKLLTTPCIHTDETSLKVDKKNYWIHVYSSGDITLKFLHQKRGKEAIEAIGIIPQYGGVIVHDCWASYLSYLHLEHGLCGSHLLRELTFIIDSNEYRWAKQLKRLLKKTCKMVAQRKGKCLNEKEYAKLQRLYKKILTQGKKELPPVPEKTTARRGKVAKSDAHNLWERLEKHGDSVLLFARNPHVSFTNNRAERDLRMAKVKQKVSGCFRVEKYAEAYCRISSYLQTMKNKNVNPLVAIGMALNNNIDM